MYNTLKLIFYNFSYHRDRSVVINFTFLFFLVRCSRFILLVGTDEIMLKEKIRKEIMTNIFIVNAIFCRLRINKIERRKIKRQRVLLLLVCDGILLFRLKIFLRKLQIDVEKYIRFRIPGIPRNSKKK